MNNNNQDTKEIYIPPNFKEGVSVFGFMIKVSNLVQAVPFVAVILILVLGFGAALPVLTKAIIIGVTCIPIVFIAMVGFNGDSLFGFIKNILRERKTRRTYYYNPRVKAEIKPFDLNNTSDQTLPREKILAFIERMKSGKNEDIEIDTSTAGFFFEDDEGYAEKPIEYMTKKERKAYEKSIKRGEISLVPETGDILYRRRKRK